MGMFNDAWGTETPYVVIHSWDEAPVRELTLEEKAERDGLSVEEYLARQKKEQEERRIREEEERQRRVEAQEREYALKHYKQLKQEFGVEIHSPEEELSFVKDNIAVLKERYRILKEYTAEEILTSIAQGLVRREISRTGLYCGDWEIFLVQYAEKYRWAEQKFCPALVETLEKWELVGYRPAYDFGFNKVVVKDAIETIEKGGYSTEGFLFSDNNVALFLLLTLFKVDKEHVNAYKDVSKRQYLFYDTNKSKMFWALYNEFVEPLYR